MARGVAKSALACAILHAAAGVGSLVLLAGGSSAVEGDVSARIAYIEAHQVAWRAGWLLWAAAGLAVLMFYSRVAPFDVPGRTAVALAATGLAVRLVADTGMALLLPLDPVLQVAVERWGLVAVGLIGHGFETLAGILIVWGAWTSDRLPRWLVMTSLPLWLSGGVLCGAVIAGSGPGVLAATVGLVVSATAWYAMVGVAAGKAD
ncbi:MAG: hypothetical protein QOC71_1515 [Thermoplasmata archaeon]|nr:hypothetical protein [Thermoplasmata archaeon]